MHVMTILLWATLAVQAPPRLDGFLRQQLGFSEANVRAVTNGSVVVKKLAGATGEEITLVGVVRLAVTAEAATAQFSNPTTWRNVSQKGRFSTPPAAGDLATFQVPREDRDLFRSCRIGKCVIKLPASVIDSLQRVDRRSAAGDAIVSAVWRSWLLDYVRGYLARGNAGLVVYADQEEPLELHTGFHALLGPSPYLFAYLPAFHHYLEEFPDRVLPGVEDVLYWFTEDPGLRPITTVTHVTVYRPDSAGVAALIALKQIYASHYFHAALTLVSVVDDRTDQGPGVYIIYLERLLFDKKLGGLIRRRAEGRLLDDLKAGLSARQRE